MTEIVDDTDVISFGFRNDSRFTYYLPHMQGLRPLMSFMTLAEIEFGVQRRNWGQERRQQLEDYLKQYYWVIHSNDALCRIWAILKAESEFAGRNLLGNVHAGPEDLLGRSRVGHWQDPFFDAAFRHFYFKCLVATLDDFDLGIGDCGRTYFDDAVFFIAYVIE